VAIRAGFAGVIGSYCYVSGADPMVLKNRVSLISMFCNWVRTVACAILLVSWVILFGHKCGLAQQAPLLRGHDGTVLCVAFSRAGDLIASGGIDGTVRIWEASSVRPIRALRGHRGPVSTLAFVSDGATLASGSFDNSLKLWDTGTGKETATLRGHKEPILVVAVSRDGRTIASSSDDLTVRLWDVSTKQERRKWHLPGGPVQALAFSGDGKTLATGSDDANVRLLNAGTDEKRVTLVGHSGPVESLAYSPDGKILASASDDRTVRLWDCVSGKERSVLRELSGRPGCLVFSPTGSALAVSYPDGRYVTWDLSEKHPPRSVYGSVDDCAVVQCCAISPSLEIVAAGGLMLRRETPSVGDVGTIWLWEPRKAVSEVVLKTSSFVVRDLAFAPDGTALASCTGHPKPGSSATSGEITLWDLRAGAKKTDLPGSKGGANCVSFSKDGRMLASGGDDKSVRLWDVATHQVIKVLERHDSAISSLSFSPKRNVLASGDRAGVVWVWDLEGGKPPCRLVSPEKEPATLGKWVLSIAFSPDGDTLAVAEYQKKVSIWDLNTCQLLKELRGHQDVVSSVAFSPDGKVLASGSWDGCVKLWDLPAGREQRTLPRSPCRSTRRGSRVDHVAFSPDGKLLAYVHSYEHLTVWDLGARTARSTLGSSRGICSIAFSPSGGTLACGEIGAIRMLSFPSGFAE
jgi:WD40 repeat protein